ncbi:sugar phosphate isomerase/epimerase family protein [Anaerocolumna xylanovorans]|uniref:Sugar phosphate isomerase/epimerase n=1 Tax=Anaerocolumna xylanovorans DSM 12503 TaxID=1121345 RepID=A0A1M7YND6_9FIRM|nr:sugar phosphate isomerase/epimerase family protein [Anaerocolumna xylanovorans]SHO54046.1 Sugar phosphate isomerase/epimerase [Anaerocolumna xylanovorans DSM 12503]
MRIGVLVHLNESFPEQMKELKSMGMDNCQLVCWNQGMMTEDTAKRINTEIKELEIDITAFWCGWPGPITWDFYEGQLNLGLVPEKYRKERIEALIRGSEFAAKLPVRDFVTHVGFLPENPYDENYRRVVEAVKQIALVCQKNKQNFLFETGQETPVTLRRAIEDTGMDNIGINFDPANLLMYGKANPVDALDILGRYVMGVHGKDGLYPADGVHLGEERPLGEGRVNYPAFIGKLKEIGYTGAITIEREIEGEEQKRDIIKGKEFLEQLLSR